MHPSLSVLYGNKAVPENVMNKTVMSKTNFQTVVLATLQ